MWLRRTVQLTARPRGFHLISGEVASALPELAGVSVGLLHVFIRHTSASLTLNESTSASVRRDLERFVRQLVPDRGLDFEHTLEGPDDMPAHIKASLLGSSLTVPVENGRLVLGTWQGIYLCEHREQGGSRSVVLTLHGAAAESEGEVQ